MIHTPNPFSRDMEIDEMVETKPEIIWVNFIKNDLGGLNIRKWDHVQFDNAEQYSRSSPCCADVEQMNKELLAALEEFGPMCSAMHDEWCEALNLPPYQPLLDLVVVAHALIEKSRGQS